jgi:hypothetical protein
MNKEYKYNCEKCDFHTNANSLYEKHLITGKHKTGQRSGRCDKKLLDKCPECDYTSISNTNMNLHILNNHSSKEKREKELKYYCKNCDYGTFAESMYKKHLESDKHKLIETFANK